MKKVFKLIAPNLLDEDLFVPEISLERSAELFKQYVTHVELENHNYCNRRCWFCINSAIDRCSEVKIMDRKIFERIVNDLRQIDYDEGLFWTRYHEPLADQSIFERMAWARKRLPNAILVMYTNGDYLNRETLSKLEDAGLDRLRISLYGLDTTSGEARQKGLDGFMARTGLTIKPEVTICGNLAVGTKIPSVFVSVPSFSKENRGAGTSSRGGVIELEGHNNFARKSICFNPVHSVNIDYNGKCVLCCHISSDVKQHRAGLVGQIDAESYGLFNFYRDLAKFRNNLISSGIKWSPCDRCNVGESRLNNFGRYPLLAKIMARTPGLIFLCEKVERKYRISRRKSY